MIQYSQNAAEFHRYLVLKQLQEEFWTYWCGVRYKPFITHWMKN